MSKLSEEAASDDGKLKNSVDPPMPILDKDKANEQEAKGGTAKRKKDGKKRPLRVIKKGNQRRLSLATPKASAMRLPEAESVAVGNVAKADVMTSKANKKDVSLPPLASSSAASLVPMLNSDLFD